MKFMTRLFSRSSREISRKMAIYEGWTARTIFNLTSGAFMAGYLKYMGSDDNISGKILALPILAAMIQFISPIIIERLNWKKNLVTIGCTIHRLMLALMVFIPLLPVTAGAKLWICGGIYFVSYLMVAFVTPAVSNMYISFVPGNIRGSYFGSRESSILIFSTIVTIAMGKILDIFEDAGSTYNGYIVLFAGVFISTVLNNLSFFFMREVRIKPCETKFRVRDVFIVPLKDKVFRKMITLFFLWNAGLQIGAPFFGIYMVSHLELSYTFITASSMVMSIFYLIFSKIWGRFADKSGWTPAVMYSVGVLGIVHLLWLFVFPSNVMFVLVPVLHAMGGIAWSGINISLFNIQFDYTPSEGRTLYLGFNAAFSGIVGYGAALLSSGIVGKLNGWIVHIVGIPVGIIQIVLSMSGAVILLASLYVLRIYRQRN
jgi:hypothetical protein